MRKLFGRGAADMKTGIAAMVVAIERLLAETPDLNGSIGMLITSDEEGDAIDGTVKVIDHLQRHGTHIDYCIVGEPSSNRRVGDMVRVGRRGSLNGRAHIRGIQGHVAYPEKVRNPIHLAAPAMAELADAPLGRRQRVLSRDRRFRSPTSTAEPAPRTSCRGASI